MHRDSKQRAVWHHRLGPGLFGYAVDPDVLLEQLRKDEAIAEPDAVLHHPESIG